MRRPSPAVISACVVCIYTAAIYTPRVCTSVLFIDEAFEIRGQNTYALTNLVLHTELSLAVLS